MPLYDLKCPECDNLKEDEFASIKEYEEGIKCDKCGAILQNVIAPRHTQYNCDGFYITDHTDYNVRRRWPQANKQEMIIDGSSPEERKR